MHDVVSVRTIRVMAVLAMQALDAEVLAEVIPTNDAFAPIAAESVQGSGHARADLPTQSRGALAQFDNFPAPLVPGNQRPRFGPETRVVALDNMWVGTADGRRSHAA